MKLNQIFQKPVERQIEGVIKADDESGIVNEIEEYVLTNEVSKRLDLFLDAYTNYQGANGAWLSGFFGSGKSHLLKMLAFLLENNSPKGISVKELFLKKCHGDKLLQAKIEKAISIPSKSILFNIDQKADIINKSQVDALLSVFAKVFDEMCGYYGKQGYIAQFERDLDERGLFQEFKAAYSEVAKMDWEKGRQQAVLENKNIAKAYSKVAKTKEEDANNLLNKYRLEYKLSIEDFAEQVNKYVAKGGPNFHLNFFVDEVGQYIADNVKLMTNLQTIAESLASRCNGKSWIIVTAQEDMNAIIGDMTKQQGNDFSKIQARFSNRLKLTSADVAEVIQIRLLSKTEGSKKNLGDLYEKQINNFKTLFDFADGSKHYKNFKDKEHFIASYPFIPYQFDLFQTSIRHLSEHNAFEGKHSSVGERSMLGVFQEVAKQILTKEIGELATFDLMFEGLRSALKTDIQKDIITAERNLDDKFAVQVLKALLLVKYVKDFKTTVRNLCVLMLNSFDKDVTILKKEVESALRLLEQQTYIQRNGDTYEFLTNEEKDIEEEIKNTEMDSASIVEEIREIIFDSIIGSKKIRYNANGHDYSFAKKIDDKILGREEELAIHIATPLNEHINSESTLVMRSMGRNELLVILPTDDRLVQDLFMFERTNRYIRQNTNTAQQDSVSKILKDKADHNQKRKEDIEARFKKLLSEAKTFIGGEQIDTGMKEAKAKLTDGFIELIKKTYPQLQMLKGANYTEQQIPGILSPSSTMMLGNEMLESEQEVLSSVLRSVQKGTRMTTKTLLTEFQMKPYGWYYEAILCILAKLCARGKVELRLDGSLLEGAELERGMINTQQQQQIVIEAQADFTASQVRKLKEFFKDYFDCQPNSQEAKALGKETADKFSSLSDELEKFLYQKEQYPFVEALRQPLEKIKSISKKQYSYFLTNLSEVESELFADKEKIVSPLKTFMGGAQKEIFKEAVTFVRDSAGNFDYIDQANRDELQGIIKDPECFKGNKIKRAKELVESIRGKIEKVLQEEREKIKSSIESLRAKVQGNESFKKLSAQEADEVNQIFLTAINSLKEKYQVASIKDSFNLFEQLEYPKIVVKLSQKAAPADLGKSNKVAQIVPLKSITVVYSKLMIEQEEDIDDYLKELRTSLVKEIEEGKKVQV